MIFTFLTYTSIARQQKKCSLVTIMLLATLLMLGCQPSSESTMADGETQASTQKDSQDNKPVAQSDSAAARIDKFQPLYVEEMQELQQRLQAEYEALEAADLLEATNGDTLSPPSTITSPSTVSSSSTSIVSTAIDKAGSGTGTDGSLTTEQTDALPTDNNININTEAGERDLEVLKLISLQPRKPIILTKRQLTERYQQAMQALYEPAITPLSAEEIDTLINAMTVVPQLFEHAEIAERLNIKSPALARLMVQHQLWQQLEQQQALDMQQMKLTQQQEFEELMAKFNETIEGYDEQIAKYEEKLEEFQ